MKVNWTKIGDKDYKAIPKKDHVLRVEQMSKGNWWWMANAKTWRTDSNAEGNPGKTLAHAKKLCEAAYKKLIDAK